MKVSERKCIAGMMVGTLLMTSAFAMLPGAAMTIRAAEPGTQVSDEQTAEPGEAQEFQDALTPQSDSKPTLWLVGDSTVCSFTDTTYYPRYGYGTQIGNYLDGSYEIRNIAASGRSSKSYHESESVEAYTTLTTEFEAGDVLIIGFGHNDEKNKDTHYTNPNGDYTVEGSFAHELYEYYIKPVKEKGGEVILCTPIVRRNDSGTFTPANLHVTADVGEFKGGDYPQAIRDLGANSNVNVPVVDLTEKTRERYLSLGDTPAAAAAKNINYHAWSSDNPASVDNTHLNYYGANVVSYLLASAIKSQNATALAAHVDLTKGDPADKEAEYLEEARNKDYVHKDYAPPVEKSELWDDYTAHTAHGDYVFHGTVFGDTGFSEVEKLANSYSLKPDTDGKMRISVADNKGKMAASTSDGFAMYYYQLSANRLFSFSAKAHINAISPDATANNQGSFGLMARDTMYIDRLDKSILDDYVVAGTLFGKDGGCNCFRRKDGAVNGRAKFENGTTIEAGKDYDLNIKYNGDGYELTFGNEPTQIGGYDFQLNSVDPQYVYIGMIAAKYFDVSYSDIDIKLAQTLTLSSNNAAWGTASAGSSYFTGDTVTLKANPAHGYRLKEWKVYKGNATINNNTFTMPAEDVEIQAVFEEVPASDYRTITIDPDIIGGTVTVSPLQDKYTPGEIVTLAAVPAAGYEFREWFVTSGDAIILVAEDGTFTMPAGDVTVSAEFKKTGGDSGNVTPSELTMVVGQTLAAVPDLSKAGESEDVAWSVDKDGKKCVKVSNGVITANKVTTKPAEVTASTASGAKWTTKVTVIDPQTDEKTKEKFAVQTSSAAKISAPKQLKLQFGAGAKDNAKKKTVSVKASGKDLKNGTVSFNKLLDENGNEIENGETVMVTGPDNKGKYTLESKAPGIVYVKWTAAVKNGEIIGDVLASFITKVIVTQPVYDVKVTLSGNELAKDASLTLDIGQSLSFDAAVDSPTDSGKIAWSVKGVKGKAGGARITKSGRLTATKAGQVTIQAKCGKGYNRNPITLTVTDPGKYVIINKDQYAVKSGKKSAVTLSGKAMEGGKAQKADAIAWSITDKDGNAVTGITKDTKPNKFNISADVPAGVYLIHASIAGSEESTAELIVK